MQGKGLSLRLSLVALVVVLVFGTLGGFSLARDAFDADYDDCPKSTRLGAIDGLTIDRTDEEDEIRISWDSLDTAELSSLGPNGYRARLTVIVDGEDARNVALGDTALVVSDIDFAEDLTVSVAVTLGDYVISDIAEADFTSGLPAPRFTSDIRVSDNALRRTDPDEAPSRTSNDLDGLTEVPDLVKAEKRADDAEIVLLRKTAEAAAAATAKEILIPHWKQKILMMMAGTPRGTPILTSLADADQPATVTQLVRDAEAIKAANVVIDGDDGPAEDADGKLRDLGTFYYLGFNDLFDNWYVKSGVAQRPRTAKFRVGLQHGASGVNAGDADFENYRIVIEDSSGDLLGYQAETVSASGTYGSDKIVFSTSTKTILPS